MFSPARKNYGYGKQLAYAVRSAVKDRYGDQSQGTQATHRNRIKHLLTFLLDRGIRDIREVDQGLLEEFGAYVRTKYETDQLALSTATNAISVANVVLGHMSGKASLRLKPSVCLRRRSRVRQTPPESLDSTRVAQGVSLLRRRETHAVGQFVLLCREFGLRAKEASLLELRLAVQQALLRGQIDIRRGTKGGRGRAVERWVPCDSSGFALLKESAKYVGSTGCLVPGSMSSNQWYQFCYRSWRVVAPTVGLSTKFHDLRTSWACDRYYALTGFLAPVLTGGLTASTAVDLRAREILSVELGHGRVDVVATYIGGRTRFESEKS